MVEISSEVSINHEVADITASLARGDGGAALLRMCKNQICLFCWWRIFSSRTALALGCEPQSIIDVMGEALESSNGVPPELVKEADWHDNCLTGEDIDLGVLPIPKHSRGDGGSFITGAVTVTKDPISGRGTFRIIVCLSLKRTYWGSM